ncbi:hypothetical protein [Luteolibacter luteus]|uniref:Uncharacterized protein n=1 Tax=Luteolibacter luteus TaxID=2728835 RepID=A0A858RSG8_9BACT|nr:hypothetical protein [Luteolibacter luteus]QJE98893.1 hypothetical protein HHL09_24965 [Luteolibacter luteus]
MDETRSPFGPPQAGFSRAELSSKAGEFFLFEYAFKDALKAGCGFLVIESGGKIQGLRSRPNFINKHAIEFVSVREFEPDQKRFVHVPRMGFWGVIVPMRFLELMGKK